MAVKDVFEVWLYADPLTALNDVSYPFTEGENITSGILNVDIVQGTDLYEGPQEQIDTGQFTIVTRNPAMDPKVNANLKYNSTIKFWDTRSGEFFRGYVTNIDVQYQRNDDPIITITGTDIFGAMQRVVVSQETHDAIMALSTGPSWYGLTFTEFLPYMYDFTSKYLSVQGISPPGYPIPEGFWFESTQSFGELTAGNLGYAPARYIPQVGETYLDIINKYAQTNLTSFSAKSGFGDPMSYDFINVSNFPKYDPYYWTPQQDPYLEYTNYDFSSNPEDGKPYETILIDNGYNRVINQIDISNEYQFVESGELKSVSESFTRISSDSIEDYAISKASVATSFRQHQVSSSYWVDKYTQNIFEVTQFPGQEIQQITFDNARFEDVENESTYSDYVLNQIVRIKHQVYGTPTIDRIYNIAGITHNISPDKWEMGFTFKPSREELMFQLQGSLPTLTMNATSGDSNFNFTATVGSIDPSLVTSITWALSAIDGSEIQEIYPYARSGNMFKNGSTRTGFTQTWNFDDDGILAPYSFDTVNIAPYDDPIDNRYGGYGPGNWYVYAFVLLDSGVTIALQQKLTVGTPVVTANFGWSQNLTNNFGTVSFTDTSTNHEQGEADSYLWTFGDGTTSTSRNPSHTYVPVGSENSYSVSLRVFAYGPGGTKVYNTKTSTVTLTQPTMVPNFTFTVDRQTATFTNTSTNIGFEEPDAYLWNFGDGTTSTLKNPVKTYGVAEGQTVSFNVTLTTRNIWEQTASITKTVTVTAFDTSGTLPISQVRLTMDNYLPDTAVEKPLYPYMFDFKAKTSYTQSNLIYLAPTTVVGNGLSAFWEADGTTADYINDKLNLTRDSSITTNDQYGLTPITANITGNKSFSFTVDRGSSTQFIKDISLTFRDIGTTNNIIYPLSSAWLNRIHVEVPDSFGGWVRIGYFQLESGRMDNTQPAGQITQAVKQMTPVRPMPMNIPYFKYTISGNTVSYQSMETGTNYYWNFDDGTSSSLKDPVKTYSTPGTKIVSLTVSFANGTTRTTTEPVIVEAPNTSFVRYVKIHQPLTIRSTEFGFPTLANLSIFNANTKLIGNELPEWGGIPQDSNESYFWTGTSTAPTRIVNPPIDINANPLTQKQLVDGTGVRVNGSAWLAGFNGYGANWFGIADFKGAFNNISNVKVDAAKFLTSVPGPFGTTRTGNPPADGPTYDIYVSSYLGDNYYTARDGAWTKIGTITPTGMVTTGFTTYNMTPV